MNELLSLKGLITVTIGSLISIKTLRVNFRISKDINVRGTGNIVIVNEALAPMQRSFQLLWPTLFFIIALTYPLLGSQYNSFLGILTIICIPFAVISFIWTIYLYGLSRVFDIFYIVGAMLSCWLASRSSSYLGYTANEASTIYPTIEYMWQGGLSSVPLFTAVTVIVTPLLAKCIAVIGFTALFLSLLYFVFAYITARSYDGALRFLLQYGMITILGFFLACNGWAALLVFHNFKYFGELLTSAIPV